MTITAVTSWGRLPRHPQHAEALRSRFSSLPGQSPQLPFGNGRSYGDVCLNDGGILVSTRALDHLIAFDPATGILECEAGVLLSEIIALLLPRGWFPAVVPGTAFVTVGGAIANDVHGKNHHRAGTFGHHVLDFDLRRSDGQLFACSPQHHQDLFHATIGGLGLTGLILKARLQLRPAASGWIAGDSQRFTGLDEFFRLTAESDGGYEYTVAWLDSTAHGRQRGRGIFMRGNHVADKRPPPAKKKILRVPFTPPISVVSSLNVRALNALYYHRPAARRDRIVWGHQDFYFPLDSILGWNRLYGPRGFFQYQCVLPDDTAQVALNEMLQIISRSGQGSFVSVLKKFGSTQSLGMMSFARPGVTLALDFPNQGAATLQLLDSLDSITRQAGGAVYPAKDARMSASSFQQYFPMWQQFENYIDPAFSSSFWRRVTGQQPCNAS